MRWPGLGGKAVEEFAPGMRLRLPLCAHPGCQRHLFASETDNADIAAIPQQKGKKDAERATLANAKDRAAGLARQWAMEPTRMRMPGDPSAEAVSGVTSAEHSRK